jgi:hypothetical protein
MDAVRAPAFAFSILNASPKIALGKWQVEEMDGALALVSGDGTHRVMPTGTLGQYHAATMHLLEHKKPLALVPEWLAAPLKKHYAVAKQHDEYVMRTGDVRALPGGRNAAMRGNVNKARRLCTIEDFDAAKLHEFLALNALWYRQNAEIKFRPYDKTSIDWLLKNWSAIRRIDPDCTCLGIRHAETRQLIALNMGCVLSDRTWSAYTQRFDRAAPLKAANMLGYTELARVFADLQEENDGTADTKTIREWKDRLVSEKRTFFVVKA